MPRRPAKIERDIPLYVIPRLVKEGVHTHRDELERIVIQKTHSHFYNVSIRTRPIKRELKGGVMCSRTNRLPRNKPGCPGKQDKEPALKGDW
jgi:hypothetical protein